MYSVRSDGITHPAGLPHSEIRGSSLDCSSPRRFAAYRVLHRPSAPRHPPCALCSLKQTPVKNKGEPLPSSGPLFPPVCGVGPSHYQTPVRLENKLSLRPASEGVTRSKLEIEQMRLCLSTPRRGALTIAFTPRTILISIALRP
jgi:hypothetical protein